jgi:hypothetical protein
MTKKEALKTLVQAKNAESERINVLLALQKCYV